MNTTLSALFAILMSRSFVVSALVRYALNCRLFWYSFTLSYGVFREYDRVPSRASAMFHATKVPSRRQRLAVTLEYG